MFVADMRERTARSIWKGSDQTGPWGQERKEKRGEMGAKETKKGTVVIESET